MSKPYEKPTTYICNMTRDTCHLSDIDECTTGEADCDQNAKCADTIGSYSCKCNYGYSGDGKICTR